MSKPLFDAQGEVADRILQAPHLLVCLDYDGTLSHFVAQPAAATLSPTMERAVIALAQCNGASLAIVSGRDRSDLIGRVDIPGVIYAGNHGLEISGPGYLFVEPTAAAGAKALEALAQEMAAKLQGQAGVLVEFKGLTITVHVRQVEPADQEEVRRLVHGVLASASHPFVLTTGNMVYEIRPRVYWNKGSAITYIREQLACPGLLPIYVGDDVTDEDAFAAIPDGIAIKVGETPETVAPYFLPGPSEVRNFLEWIVSLLRKKHLAA